MAARSQLINSFCHFSLSLLRLQRLPHSEGNAAFEEGLVGLDRHLNLVLDPRQEKAPLSAVNSDLSNQLVKRLHVQLLPNGTNARFPRLLLLQPLVELLLQEDDVLLRGRCWRHILNPQLACFHELLRRQKRVQVVFVSTRLRGWLALAPSALATRRHQDLGVVLDQGNVGLVKN